MVMPNLGIALGAGTRQYLQMDKEDKDEAFRQEQLGMQKASGLRQQQMHEAQMGEIARQADERKRATEVWANAQKVFQGGADAAAENMLARYNSQDGALGYGDSHTAKMVKTDKGYQVTRFDPEGKQVGTPALYTPQQAMQEHMRGVYSDLAAINPAYGDKLMTFLENIGKEDTRKAERAEDKAHTAEREKVGDKFKQEEIAIHRQNAGRAARAETRAQQDQDWQVKDRQRKDELRQLASGYSAVLRHAAQTGDKKAIDATIYDASLRDADLGKALYAMAYGSKEETEVEDPTMPDSVKNIKRTKPGLAIAEQGEGAKPGGAGPTKIDWANAARPKTKAERDALQPGTPYIDLQGRQAIR